MCSSLPWPKTPLCTVFLNLLSKNCAICDVFNNMVAQNTAICEVFTFSRKELKLRHANTNVAQQKRRKPSTKQHRNHKICPAGLPTRHGKNTHLKTAKRRPTVKKHCFICFHFSLAGSGRARARTSPFRAAKHSVFEVRRRDLSKTNGFCKKIGTPPQVNLYLTVVYAIRMITP